LHHHCTLAFALAIPRDTRVTLIFNFQSFVVRAVVNVVEFNEVFAFTLMALQFAWVERAPAAQEHGLMWLFADVLGALSPCLSSVVPRRKLLCSLQ
jgi:hypothetical protein